MKTTKKSNWIGILCIFGWATLALFVGGCGSNGSSESLSDQAFTIAKYASLDFQLSPSNNNAALTYDVNQSSVTGTILGCANLSGSDGPTDRSCTYQPADSTGATEEIFYTGSGQKGKVTFTIHDQFDSLPQGLKGFSGLPTNFITNVMVVGSTIYVTTNGGLSISTDGGASFTNKTTANGLGNNYVRGVAVSGSTIYAATAGGLSISTDGGASFINKTTANGLGDNSVLGVTVSGSIVYAATYGGLSISTDGGTSFTNKTTANGLGSNIVNVVAVSGSTVYAATDSGLSISTDGGTSFTNKTTTSGLGSNAIRSVTIDMGRIYVATAAGLGRM